MNKLQLKINTLCLLFFILLLTFCHKEDVKPVPDPPKPVIFYIQNANDGKSEPNVFITLQKRVANQVDSFENVLELGRTDASGKLVWNYDKTSLPENHRFLCTKQHFKPTIIPITDLSKKAFTGKIFNPEQLKITFSITTSKYGQPVSEAEIFVEKQVPGHSDFYDPISTLGKTDINGQLIWNFDQDSIPKVYRFRVKKTGYYDGFIPVDNSFKNDFNGTLGEIAVINFHLKYHNDTLPKRFAFYYGAWEPANSYYNPGGYYRHSVRFIPDGWPVQDNQLITQIDTSFSFHLNLYTGKQDFHCVIFDNSWAVNSSLSFDSKFPQKDFIVPGNSKDTTFLFEAFW